MNVKIIFLILYKDMFHPKGGLVYFWDKKCLEGEKGKDESL